MSRRDDNLALRHMLSHAREAVALIQGRQRADLDSDRLLNLGLVRLVEIVGEAANRVGAPTQQANPAIPWAEIVSMRNRLIHGYDRVDFDILWAVLTEDLPRLIKTLEAVVR